MTDVQTMLDRPDDAEMDLVQVIGDLMLGGNGQLPTELSVVLNLESRHRDGHEVLRSLRRWGGTAYGLIYQVVETDMGGNNFSRYGLTVYGFRWAKTYDGENYIKVFLAALKAAVANQEHLRQRSVAYELTQLQLPVEIVLGRVNKISSVDLGMIDGLFSHELPTWNFWLSGDKTFWDTTRSRILRYADIDTVDDYLAKLTEDTQQMSSPPPITILPWEAIPEAIDNLNVAYRAKEKEWLLQPRNALNMAGLGQAANNADEFATRCSSLKTIFDRITPVVPKSPPPDGAKSLVLLRHYFAENFSASDAQVASDAISVLQLIGRVRDATTHEGGNLTDAAVNARLKLGLARFSDDWNGQWNLVRLRAVEAMRVIRNLIVDSL